MHLQHKVCLVVTGGTNGIAAATAIAQAGQTRQQIRTAFHATMPPEVKSNNLANPIPLHREGAPEQVATLIREVITNDYLTGETFVIDGGLTMRIC